MGTLTRRLARIVNVPLGALGLQLSRRRSFSPANGHVGDYIDAKSTIRAARREGISVAVYLDRLWGEAGVTQRVIDDMEGAIDWPARDLVVCEIGTGSGKFAEELIRRRAPARYESYEPDVDWAEWLVTTHGIVSHPSDGRTLAHTADGSVDLVVAHGVFVYTPIVTTLRYFAEMARVARAGGYAVFDVFTEDCFAGPEKAAWLQSELTYPVLVPRTMVLGEFATRGFSLRHEFFGTIGPGKSRYFVFQREGGGAR